MRVDNRTRGGVSIDLDVDAAEAVVLRRAGPVQMQDACVLSIDRSVVIVEKGGHCVTCQGDIEWLY